MKVDNITKRDQDFAKWYTDVVKEADLVDYSGIKGSVIIRPYGYAIWEEMVSILDKMFKDTNHENVQLPMFIPESLLNIEKDHVEGFAPEVAWVTHGGSEKLEERLCIRPTSEVLFCEHYKKIIKSYRDLPKLYNQWCTIVRWEKTTRPFLRSREIMWQEGHTMHVTREEAIEESLKMLDVYKTFQEEYLAIPVLTGKKTDKEKFAGAHTTYTVEAMMYDGIALQNGTTHYLGDNFSKVFNIEFLDRDNTLKNPHQTSWGLSTRMIGSIIMVHGDDNGLVIPPKIAPIKVVIIPIKNGLDEARFIKEELIKNNISAKIDESDERAGFKFAEAEVKGYPIRIEIGDNDILNNEVTIVRRDKLEKIKIKRENLIKQVNYLLKDIQDNLFEKAKIRRDSMLHETDDYSELINISREKQGFIKVPWCGSRECEEKISDATGLKSRLITEDIITDVECISCSNKANHKIYFGKQY